MKEINLSFTDRKGNLIFPNEAQSGNSFAAQFLPQSGDTVILNGTQYTVRRTTHRLFPDKNPDYSIEVDEIKSSMPATDLKIGFPS